jgi:hypothetical protein
MTSFSFKGKPNQQCKGQASLYDHLLILGPLTDRKIEEYELEGKYGPDRQQEAKARLALKEVEEKRRAERSKAKVKHAKTIKAMVMDLI